MGGGVADRGPAEELAVALRGLGGAPGRPGVVHYVTPVDEDGAGSLTARASVLLASADVVLTDSMPDPLHQPALLLARGARTERLELGSVAADALADAARAGAIVVRYVDHFPLFRAPGATAELEVLAATGVPYELEPAPPSWARARVDEPLDDVYFTWQDRLPLRGMTVLVPRTRQQASRLAMHVRSLGGTPVEAPTIAVEPGDEAGLRERLRELADGRFVALCLTSPNGVRAVAAALGAAGLDARAFAAAGTVATVGPGTAATLLDELGVRPDLVPERATTEGLADAFPAGKGEVLLPRADIATEMLADGLAAKGYTPVPVDAYRTVRPGGLPEQARRLLATGGVDLIPFASSSTATNFVDLIGDGTWSGDVVSIGPVTSATCRELGLDVAVEADPHTLAGLVAAMTEAAERRRGAAGGR